MKKVIEIFKAIQDTSSLNEKSAIIATNKENELFKKCLVFLLDDMILTGISDKKIHKNVFMTDKMDITCNFETIMDYLKDNNTGRDSDLSIVQGFINAQDEENKEFYEQMITKTFRLGCSSKVVNKVIPELIPVFDVMLGTPVEKCKLKGNEYIYLSQKLNGTRSARSFHNRIMTRQGKEYVGLDHILSDIHKLKLDGKFIDGELLYKNKEELSDSEAFQKGTGIANSKSSDKSQLKLVIFDIFPMEEFWNGKSIKKYGDRKKDLLQLNEQIAEAGLENLEVIQFLYEGTDHSEIWKWLDYAEENDWEGVILNLDSVYECKRTKNLIKVKKFFSCDIECIGMEEGAGRNKGKLGSLICDYKGNKVNVGSGFTDEQRNYYWNNANEVIGKIISVKYKEETQNKDGGVSIQFPVFEGVRFDKIEPSYN